MSSEALNSMNSMEDQLPGVGSNKVGAFNIQRVVINRSPDGKIREPIMEDLDIERVVLVLSYFDGKPVISIKYVNAMEQYEELVIKTPTMLQLYAVNGKFAVPSFQLTMPESSAPEHQIFGDFCQHLHNRLTMQMYDLCMGDDRLLGSFPQLQGLQGDREAICNIVSQMLLGLVYQNREGKPCMRLSVKIRNGPSGVKLVTNVHECGGENWAVKGQFETMEAIGRRNEVRALVRLDSLFHNTNDGRLYIAKTTYFAMVKATDTKPVPQFDSFNFMGF